jgi:DNA-binding response OmpR family regulator/HPt (histidine-containing phosphotransfer) domain-containing protein
MKILLIDDDDAFTKVLTRTLKAHHYSIDSVTDGEAGWTYGSTFDYDLMVVDIMLPKVDGITLCQRFRAEGYDTPILLLTAQSTNTAKVQGLDAGADDYLVKPFDPAELLARIRALLRRGRSNPMPLLSWGDLFLNPSTCEVQYKGQVLALTGKEYELLELMLRDSQHVFGVDELLEHLWSSEEFPSEATVRSHIRRVRQKLVASGAPQDFISTMHGRGYYLKPVDPNTSACPAPNSSVDSAINAVGEKADPSPNSTTGDSSLPPSTIAPDASSLSNTENQYLAFLNETWKTTQPNCLEHVAELVAAIADLDAGQLTPDRQAEARQRAHKLVGTLGLFGVPRAVRLARQLEHWLGSSPGALPAHQAASIQPLVHELQHIVQTTRQIRWSQLPKGPSPRLLLISSDAEFYQALRAIAPPHGIEVNQLLPGDMTASTLHADIILLHVAAPISDDGSSLYPPLSYYLQVLAQHYPDVPLLVIGDRLGWHDRLAVAQRGGRSLLSDTPAPEDVLVAAMRLLQDERHAPKVMVVDDDLDWLGALPTLLQPWKFKITTLADPQEFLSVLQGVTPDVLILDINMPAINGFELCQILRSDPHWQKLPVLFLSVRTDASSRQKAFAAGADDYLQKPLHGGELAHRILHRLQRIRAYNN